MTLATQPQQALVRFIRSELNMPGATRHEAAAFICDVDATWFDFSVALTQALVKWESQQGMIDHVEVTDDSYKVSFDSVRFGAYNQLFVSKTQFKNGGGKFAVHMDIF